MKEPTFNNLTYADSGLYVCEASMTGLVRRQSFDLVVEGQQLLNSPSGFRQAKMDFLWMLSLSQDSFRTESFSDVHP